MNCNPCCCLCLCLCCYCCCCCCWHARLLLTAACSCSSSSSCLSCCVFTSSLSPFSLSLSMCHAKQAANQASNRRLHQRCLCLPRLPPSTHPPLAPFVIALCVAISHPPSRSQCPLHFQLAAGPRNIQRVLIPSKMLRSSVG